MTLLSQWFSLWNRPGLPPLHHDTLPGKGWSGSALGLKSAWLFLKIKRWWIFQKKKWRSVGTNRQSILKAYAQQVGFPLDYIRENYWPGPFTYSQLPVISITAKELEFPHSIRPNLHYVGPMVYDQRKDVQANSQISNYLKQLIKDSKSKGQSIIYCSVSSFKKGDQQFLKKIIEAINGQNQWMIILGMGGLLKEETLGELPDNIHAFSWVPQLEVLTHADCSINHGGIHTINECIHFQVPMLVYSGKRSDQNGCAARVAYHKVGIMADKDQDNAMAIRKNIQEVLQNDLYRKNIKNLHQQIQKYKKENRLAKTIEQWMEENQSIQTSS